MTTDQIESFIQVAENLNFARAAENLQITQSAVSRQIHSLEDELGVRLFHRTTRTVTLTPAGITFLDDAKHMIGCLHSAKQKLLQHQNSSIQVLTIGSSSEENLDLLCKILKICRKEIPELYPFLKVIPHRSLLNLFYQGDLDLLLGFRDDIPEKPDMIYKELFSVPLCWIAASDHPFAERKEISLEEVISENLVVCNSYSVPYGALKIQNQLESQLPPQSVYPCENLQVLLTLVRAGYGCSILPHNTNRDNSEIIQIPLKNTNPLSYGLFYKKESSSPLLKKFLSLCSRLD